MNKFETQSVKSFKSCLFLLILSNLYPQVYSQNLVENFSFEDYKECPDRFNQLDRCKNWFSTGHGSSPDYYNKCHTYNPYIGYSVGVPKNIAGLQEPRTGSGYVGIMLFAADDDFYYREYVQGSFKDALEKDQKYEFSFYISLAESSRIYSDRISICFSNENELPSKIPHPALYCKNAITVQNINFTDSENWVEVKGLYEAIGGENYLTIGLFMDDISKKKINAIKKINLTGLGDRHCYYYIEDVSVVKVQDDFSHH